MQEGARGLEEEEGLFGGCVAEFFDVGSVVAADAGDCAGGAEELWQARVCVSSGGGEEVRGRARCGGVLTDAIQIA